MTTETLAYHTYVVSKEQPSAIDPDAVVIVRTHMLCPRCKHEQPIMRHAEQRYCPQCSLQMTLYGNRLECTAE